MYQLPCPEPMSKSQILEKAHQFFQAYLREVGEDHVLKHGINFDEVYDALIYPCYEVILVRDQDLGVDDSGERILGQFLPKENTALIDKKLYACKDPRQVFTQWHEVAGHGVLHGKFLRKKENRDCRLYSTQTSMNQFENAFEWQANTFAANVAAPLNYVRCIFTKLFGTKKRIRYYGPGRYDLYCNNEDRRVYVDSVSELAKAIAKQMQQFFGGLSIQSLSYQVQQVAIDNCGDSMNAFASSQRSYQTYSSGSSWQPVRLGVVLRELGLLK